MKSGNKKYIDAVSCYESEQHKVSRTFYQYPIKLYLLGLGGGLQVNLNNIDFGNISEIYVTIKDPSIRNGVIAFLSEKYKVPETEIKIYSTCEELINACFIN